LSDGSGNYCRNPDGGVTIWCYTTNRNKRWDYCDPLKVNAVWKESTGTYLSGNNDKKIKTSYIEECKKACVEETSFLCKSFDFYKRGKYCNLSKKAPGDKGVSTGRSSDYTLYQRIKFAAPKTAFKKYDKGRAISGWNTKRITGGTIEDCKDSCYYEKSFYCRSIDYTTNQKWCDLSIKSFKDSGIRTAYNSNLIHVERNDTNSTYTQYQRFRNRYSPAVSFKTLTLDLGGCQKACIEETSKLCKAINMLSTRSCALLAEMRSDSPKNSLR
jgi:hypothetical protein